LAIYNSWLRPHFESVGAELDARDEENRLHLRGMAIDTRKGMIIADFNASLQANNFPEFRQKMGNRGAWEFIEWQSKLTENNDHGASEALDFAAMLTGKNS